MRRAVACLSSFAFVVTVQGAADTQKAPWQWSVEERLQVRFDPELAKQRARIAETDARPDAVDGTRNPELLLPSELFNWLMGGLHPDAGFGRTSRAMVQDGLRDFGWTEEQFWSDLDALTRDYADRAAKRSALQMRIDRAPRSEQRELRREAERLDRAFCQARVSALESAREHFGRETFDRFLYTVVAPGLVISPTSPQENTPDHLRYMEGGCR